MAHMAPTGISPESPHSPEFTPRFIHTLIIIPSSSCPHVISSLGQLTRGAQNWKDGVSLTICYFTQKEKKNSRK